MIIIRVTTSCHCQVFIFLRWCVAISSIALFTCGYVYCMEMVAITSIITLLLLFIIIITNLITILFTQVGGVWCTLIGIGLEFPWALGYMSLPLVCFSSICHTFFFVRSCPPFFLCMAPQALTFLQVAWILPTWTHLQLAISLPWCVSK